MKIRRALPTLAILVLALFVIAVPPVSAQICGDANCDGALDIGDITTIFDYFVVGGPSYLPCYNNCEADGHSNVNISDFLQFLFFAQPCFPEFCPPLHCSPLQPPLNPVLLAGNEVGVEPSKLPPNTPGPFVVNLFMKSTAPFEGFAVPFRILVGGAEAPMIPGSLRAFALRSVPVFSIRASGNFMLARGASLDAAPAGTYRILQFAVAGPTPPGPDSVPVTLQLVPFPGEINPNTGDSANHPLFIGAFGDATGAYVLPIVNSSFACCDGQAGNIDCDNLAQIDIGDLTALIDHLYISMTPLCCRAAANCDGSPDGDADISDLTALINFLYITFEPMAACL